jgi:HEAT repeat protein
VLVLGADEPMAEGKPLSHWIKQLEEGGPQDRERAAKAVLSLGPKGAPAVPALAKALKEDKVEGVRRASAQALGKIGPSAKAAVPALADALQDKSRIVSNFSAQALGAIGSDAKEAVPALVATLNGADKERHMGCVLALGHIRHPDAKALLALKGAALNGPPVLSGAASQALGKLGKAAVPALIEIAQKKGIGGTTALEALATIGPDAKEAVPGLIKLLGDNRGSGIRTAAADALGAIGPDAKEALPALERLRREDALAGQAAAAAIKRIAGK